MKSFQHFKKQITESHINTQVCMLGEQQQLNEANFRNIDVEEVSHTGKMLSVKAAMLTLHIPIEDDDLYDLYQGQIPFYNTKIRIVAHKTMDKRTVTLVYQKGRYGDSELVMQEGRKVLAVLKIEPVDMEKLKSGNTVTDAYLRFREKE